jgi:hypothetical protein
LSQLTDKDGRFQFDDIHLYDTTILVLQGSFYNERRAQRRERRGLDDRDADTGTPGLLSFRFPGYYQAREFYSPVYDKTGTHDNQPDYRTTLFCEPEIKTGEDGRATVSFYTSDKSSVYRIIVEGMTETGIPVVKSSEFWVQENKF